jgi:glycerol-3-phosphate dehydrogenase
VRPLYEPPEDGDTDADGQADTTDLTRGFALLDHESRDGVWGMTTVVGGKLTTHRLMAERVADHVCGKFGIDRPCRTDEIPLPGSREPPEETAAALADLDVPAPTAEHTHERQGARAAEVLDAPEPNPVVCPCRQVTRAEVREALAEAGTAATDLDAVRRRTGVTTGDCQGAWCVHRVAAELHPEHGVEAVTRSLDALYQERWDGGRHALWGEQLGRAMDAYALHATTMNRDRPVDGADLSAFDAGPTAGGGGDGESGDGESGDSDASGDGDAVATDGGPAGGDGGGGDAAGGGRR